MGPSGLVPGAGVGGAGVAEFDFGAGVTELRGERRRRRGRGTEEKVNVVCENIADVRAFRGCFLFGLRSLEHNMDAR